LKTIAPDKIYQFMSISWAKRIVEDKEVGKAKDVDVDIDKDAVKIAVAEEQEDKKLYRRCLV